MRRMHALDDQRVLGVRVGGFGNEDGGGGEDDDERGAKGDDLVPRRVQRRKEAVAQLRRHRGHMRLHGRARLHGVGRQRRGGGRAAGRAGRRELQRGQGPAQRGERGGGGSRAVRQASPLLVHDGRGRVERLGVGGSASGGGHARARVQRVHPMVGERVERGERARAFREHAELV